MSHEILVTDSLFIGPEHEQRMKDKGFEVFRLDKPKASEAELIAAIEGKVGYILGGVESVTGSIIRAASSLKVIAFTGSGYSEFIPCHKDATELGIAITAAKGGNAEAVSEYTLAMILMMARSIPLLTVKEGSSFKIGKNFASITIGVIGFGNIGKKVAEKCSLLGFKVIVNKISKEQDTIPYNSMEIDELLQTSDIISLHVSKGRGENVLSRSKIAMIKNGTTIINAAFPHALDEEALIERVRNKEIYAAFDAPPSIKSDDYPPGFFVASNAQTAFNTAQANTNVSDMVTTSLLNILSGQDDPYLVNPSFRNHRR